MTAVRLTFTLQASQGVAAGYEWYEAARPGLGDAFLLQVEVAARFLCRHPESAARVHGEVRRKLVRRFPYAIYYRFASYEVDVVGVRPTAGDPADLFASVAG